MRVSRSLVFYPNCSAQALCYNELWYEHAMCVGRSQIMESVEAGAKFRSSFSIYPFLSQQIVRLGTLDASSDCAMGLELDSSSKQRVYGQNKGSNPQIVISLGCKVKHPHLSYLVANYVYSTLLSVLSDSG